MGNVSGICPECGTGNGKRRCKQITYMALQNKETLMRSLIRFAAIFLIVVPNSSCLRPRSSVVLSATSTLAERDVVEYVIVLPGILGGASHDVHRLVQALQVSDLSITPVLFDWTRLEPQWSIVVDLLDNSRNRRRATELANQLKALKAREPEAKFSLVAISGGTRIVYFLCESEALPGDFTFEKIVMLSGSVSAKEPYDHVVKRASKGVYNYSSSMDPVLFLFLGLTRPIGLYGYNPHGCEIRQLHWRPSMILRGNSGGHAKIVHEPGCSECLVPVFDPTSDDWPAACKQ
jgi:hypothetical protein